MKRVNTICFLTKIRIIVKKIGVVLDCLGSSDPEKKEIFQYVLKTRSIPIFPYLFAEEYDFKDVIIEKDADGYPYVLHNGRRLFLKKEWNEEECQKYYNSIRVEQDYRSPHKYLTDELRWPGQNDIVADIGAAEGFFGLDVIDKIKKLYLFETDDTWIVPLEKTFYSWKDKVCIVKKYVSDTDDMENVRLDTFFADDNVTYLKADIEGAEELMIKGGIDTINNKVQKVLICVYHLPNQEKNIRYIMENSGFSVSMNKGYMLYTVDLENLKKPYLRHGVLFAEKK